MVIDDVDVEAPRVSAPELPPPARVWTTEELAQMLAVTEHTLSELLVLLYQVLQTNQSLLERAYREHVEPGTGQ